ncbi:MAG: transposase [Anaerolineae bacterium]|nr:transposase [Anaerolineae bacterium]MBT4310100.1 transposase [Anaerolineae bacterium]MBT4457829.1 transposase [Anaerolineae bacterium]MBT6059747.1 transposase [Anaerolineae bacterium]MBT6321005.1 transposase [Anaerolineae bacterium]
MSFVDSTPIKVCHNRRIKRNKVFAGLAAHGKTTTGWFYGFKLHLVVNDHGEVLAFQLTPGNVDDRNPVPFLFDGLFGKVVCLIICTFALRNFVLSGFESLQGDFRTPIRCAKKFLFSLNRH